jgi:hypothetical protein
MKKGDFKNFFGKFRGETVILILTITASVITILNVLPESKGTLPLLIVAFSILIILLLNALLFNLKRFFRLRFEKLDINFEEYKSRLEAVDHILIDFFGFSWRENQFFARLQHFVDEKKKLASISVQELLPELLETIYKSTTGLENINIILDSGTTITPLFPFLMKFGFPEFKSVKVNYFTNNLAGVDEIHKSESNDNFPLQERDFNLIGGSPLNKYRATTGDVTQKFLEELEKSQKESDGKTITVGIITANWLICGLGLDKLQICARGEGHYDFKEKLVSFCEYIIVLAPLGKIIPKQNVKEFNKIIDDDERSYNAFLIPEEKRNKTYLLTTFRKQHSLSPLRTLSDRLRDVYRNNYNKNFIFSDKIPQFEPKTTRSEAIVADLPHDYIREKFEEVYGYPMPVD